jgi:glycosyltransferase involved in cell wall biosynthesis
MAVRSALPPGEDSGRSGRRPFRVLLVAARFFPHIGGVETHVYQVARRLVADGIDVTVLTTDPGGRLPSSDELEGVQILRVRSWPAERDYYFAPGVYRRILAGRWDVVNCVGYHTFVAPLAMLAALRARIPLIVTLQSGGHSSQLRNNVRRLQQGLLRPLLGRAQRIVAISQFEADLFRTSLRLPADRFALIPNGSDLPLIGCPGEAGGETLIVSLGRLERYKGHHRVIRALPRVIEEFPDVRLRVVGAGTFEEDLRRLTARLSLTSRVEIGAIPGSDRAGLAELLARANLLALLSEYESQGIAALEGLAVGCPVLVAATSALQELADRGLARAVSIDATSAEVAAAILGQLRDPLIPPHVELPTWDDCAARLLALYREVAGPQT